MLKPLDKINNKRLVHNKCIGIKSQISGKILISRLEFEYNVSERTLRKKKGQNKQQNKNKSDDEESYEHEHIILDNSSRSRVFRGM